MPYRYFPRLYKVLPILIAATYLIRAQPLVGQAPAAGAPVTVNLNQLYQDGMNAFHMGDYQNAVTNLESLLSQAAQVAQLEPAYFTLGAAYFNLKQYSKSVDTFKTYLEKFPKSPRVFEAVYSMGRANLLNKDYVAAAECFKQLEGNPQMREEALLSESMAYKEAGQIEAACGALEKLLGSDIRTSQMANGAIMLASLYAEKHDSEKALSLLQRLQKKVNLVDNVIKLNSLAVELGDSMLQNQKPDSALVCYRVVRTHGEVIQFQSARIEDMQKKIEQNTAALRANPESAIRLIAENNQLKTTVDENQALLAEFQKLPDFQPALLLRIGRCFYEMGQKWESIVAYQELIDRYPNAKEKETALYGAIVSSSEVNRAKQTRDYCEEYLKSFPQGPNVNVAGYLLGATALQANDYQAAEGYFGRMIKEQPASTFREQMRFLLGNARFVQGKYDEAEKDYEQYVSDFPSGTHLEEVQYRQGMTSLFAGKYEDAMKKILDYIAKYPNGNFIADAKYRLAVCKYAASLYDEVIADCRSWEKEFGKDPMIGEVMSLLGDALAASNKEDEAVEIYIRASKLATTEEVTNYTLASAEKLMQKKGAWDKIGQMYEEFVQQHPEDPSIVTAVYWIGKAKVHEGKVDEAKQFIAETIKKYIGDPKRDAVEQLLTQLAQLCVKKKPADAALPIETGTKSPQAAAPEQADPSAELDALLGDATANQFPLAKARILYAKSELARMRRQVIEQQKDLQAIADNFKPEDLSPMLLAQVGDYLLEKNSTDKAGPIFRELMDNYPKSELLEFAYNGLAEIAYRQKQYDVAFKLFSDAIDKAGASQKLKDVTVGKAKTLLAMGRLDESKKIFEQIASIREWRGDATAFSVYSLGEIAQKQGNFAEAIAFYQRVYVAYQRFLPWVAKAYTSSGECFEKLGKPQDAVNTYKEMLRNEKLVNFPETETARKRLQEAGQG